MTTTETETPATTRLDCGCVVKLTERACWHHHEREYGIAYPGCKDCRFDVVPLVHHCATEDARP